MTTENDTYPLDPGVPVMYANPIRSMWGAAPMEAGLGASAAVAEQIGMTRGQQSAIRNAGRYAAHTIRLRGLALCDTSADYDVVPAWPETVRGIGEAINSRDEDRRMRVGLDLRRSFSRHPTPSTEGDGAALLAKWLVTTNENDVLVVTAHLAREVLMAGPGRYESHIAAAWWATYGMKAAARLKLADLAGRAGRAWGEDQDTRALQREVALGMASGRMWSKTQIADACGISRPTLDAWVAELA